MNLLIEAADCLFKNPNEDTIVVTRRCEVSAASSPGPPCHKSPYQVTLRSPSSYSTPPSNHRVSNVNVSRKVWFRTCRRIWVVTNSSMEGQLPARQSVGDQTASTSVPMLTTLCSKVLIRARSFESYLQSEALICMLTVRFRIHRSTVISAVLFYFDACCAKDHHGRNLITKLLTDAAEFSHRGSGSAEAAEFSPD